MLWSFLVSFRERHFLICIPVGTVFLAGNIIYPALIGNDIGCGMKLFATDIGYTVFAGKTASDNRTTTGFIKRVHVARTLPPWTWRCHQNFQRTAAKGARDNFSPPLFQIRESNLFSLLLKYAIKIFISRCFTIMWRSIVYVNIKKAMKIQWLSMDAKNKFSLTFWAFLDTWIL